MSLNRHPAVLRKETSTKLQSHHGVKEKTNKFHFACRSKNLGIKIIPTYSQSNKYAAYRMIYTPGLPRPYPKGLMQLYQPVNG